MAPELPTFDLDPFSDELLANPYDYYRDLRDSGPVFSLPKYNVLGIARFSDVRAAFRDWKTFSSTEGPSFNDFNKPSKDTVLCMEPPDHNEARAVLTSRLRLAELQSARTIADRKAEEMVNALVERKSFDAMGDLVEPFVSSFVGELLGIPDSHLEIFVTGSSAGFTAVGPPNQRTMDALPTLGQLFAAMGDLTKADMKEGSIGWDILDADERGEIPEAMRAQLMYNFTGPAFDTTINAMGNIMWLLATHPDQWKLLRGDPSLVAAAINEGMRIESPIQIWSRYCFEDTRVQGTTIPGGTRVALFIGSTGRDERHYLDPDTFDIRRNPTDHLGLGHGIHLCVGAPLARIEIASVINAFLKRTQSLELAGDPTLRLNNTTRGFANVPITVS
jgi:cytochrome P450